MMAVDTREKRFSMLEYGAGYSWHTLFEADGTTVREVLRYQQNNAAKRQTELMLEIGSEDGDPGDGDFAMGLVLGIPGMVAYKIIA